jgi:putative tributyrin esterase
VYCGTDDELIASNERFVRALLVAGVRHDYEFGPGIHDWAYWDARIQDVLAWLPLRAIA